MLKKTAIAPTAKDLSRRTKAKAELDDKAENLSRLSDPINMEATLAEYMGLIAERERLNELDRRLGKRKGEIESQLIRFSETSGLKSFEDERIRITVDEKMRAKYDPEQWPNIMKWAAESGHDFIIQRRLSDQRVISLIVEGVELPDGLTTEPYMHVSFRRK